MRDLNQAANARAGPVSGAGSRARAEATKCSFRTTDLHKISTFASVDDHRCAPQGDFSMSGEAMFNKRCAIRRLFGRKFHSEENTSETVHDLKSER